MVLVYRLSVWLSIMVIVIKSTRIRILVFAMTIRLCVFFLVLGSFSELCLSASGLGTFLTDPVSVAFVSLSFFISLVSLLAISRNRLGLFVLINLFLVRLFSFRNIFFFFVILELVIIPIFLIIGRWGSYKERLGSSYYFIFYSFITPIPLLLRIRLIMSNRIGPCFGLDLPKLSFEVFSGLEVFCLLVGFLSKLPIFGFHIWLPKAHVDAPVGRSIVLAGILLKIRSYGLIRISVMRNFLRGVSTLFLCVRVFGALWCGILCVRLVDYKVIVAFSSVAHMSISFSGLVSRKFWGIEGSFLVYVGHGLVSPALFLIGGLLYERSNSRLLKSGSLARNLFFVFFLLIVLINFGFPPFINFWGEMRIFYCIYSFSEFLGIFLFLGFLFSRVFIILILTIFSISNVTLRVLNRAESLILVIIFLRVVYITCRVRGCLLL